MASLLNQSLLLKLRPLFLFGLCPSNSTYNRPRPTRFYFLGLFSRFRAFLTAGLLLADQGLPSGHGSRRLFNFRPQHFKIISQDLDCGQKIWIFSDAQFLPYFPHHFPHPRIWKTDNDSPRVLLIHTPWS